MQPKSIIIITAVYLLTYLILGQNNKNGQSKQLRTEHGIIGWIVFLALNSYLKIEAFIGNAPVISKCNTLEYSVIKVDYGGKERFGNVL